MPGKTVPGEAPLPPAVSFFSSLLLFYLAAPGLSWGTQDFQASPWPVGSSSLTRDGTWAPELGARSLNHWTTREVQPLLLLLHRDSDCQILLVSPPSAGGSARAGKWLLSPRLPVPRAADWGEMLRNDFPPLPPPQLHPHLYCPLDKANGPQGGISLPKYKPTFSRGSPAQIQGCRFQAPQGHPESCLHSSPSSLLQIRREFPINLVYEPGKRSRCLSCS